MNIILELIGGLGLFLLGMKMMSEGMEKAAGAKLRGFLEVMTKNRLVAVFVGAIFTAIIQSSSTVTVMVVSFVNAGLMSLGQAVGLIMGANIGTTITSQLVALDLSQIAPIFLLAGVIMIMFLKKPMIKKVGEVVLGFGVLFVGLNTMSGSMEHITEDFPVVLDVFASLKNPFLAILLGLAVTAAIQSSSVTVSILLLLARQELIGLPMCFFIIMGCNIGACVSAVLAGLSGKKEAKRASMIHLLLNSFSTVLFSVVLLFGSEYIEGFIRMISGDDAGRCIANANTLFNVSQAIIFFPFANGIVKLTRLIIPGEDSKEEEMELHYIGKHAVYSPATAMVEAVHEIEDMGSLAMKNLQDSVDAFFERDSEKCSRVYQVEKRIDFLSREITDYLVKINQQELPVADSMRIGGLFHVVIDIERIGDHAENFADAATNFLDNELELSKKAARKMEEMYGKVKEILTLSLEMFLTENQANLNRILELEREIDEMERKLQKSHIKRLSKGKCSPQAGVVYTDMITGLERVADHATNIAFSILDKDPEEDEE